jgi:uncharacterized protein (TIGR00255 family)
MSFPASMTGFADATENTPQGSVTVELRSVNSRFLELHLRLPDDVRQAEAGTRERLQAGLSRGKIECRVSVAKLAQTDQAHLNDHELTALARLAAAARQAIPEASPMTIADILRWPGIVDTPGTQPEIWRDAMLIALERAIQSLRAAREREGKALATVLQERCDGILAVIDRLRQQLPQIQAELERRLQERLGQSVAGAGTLASISPSELQERIRVEIGLHGIRTDIAEEMDRLLTHVSEVRRVLRQGGATGRRLDFLMQELNREANTIGSKASGIDITNAAVELKLLIEQMREQVQNLE